MGMIQNTDTTACLFLHHFPHTFGERTGATNGSAFADTGSKSNGVRALFYQRTVSQHRFFRGSNPLSAGNEYCQVSYCFFLNYLGPAIQNLAGPLSIIM